MNSVKLYILCIEKNKFLKKYIKSNEFKTDIIQNGYHISEFKKQ